MADVKTAQPKAPKTSSDGQTTSDPGQLQSSMDLLSIAIGQTSRDPTILANVLQNIERRRQEALSAAAGEQEQQRKLELVQAQGEQERQTQRESLTAASERLNVEQSGAMQRSILEQRGAGARTALQEQGETERQATQRDFLRQQEGEKALQDMISDMGTQLSQLLPESTRVGGGGGIQGLLAGALNNIKSAGPIDEATSNNITAAFQNVARQVPTFNVQQALAIVKGIAYARAAALPSEELAGRATSAIDIFSDQMKAITDKLSRQEKLTPDELDTTSQGIGNGIMKAIRSGQAPEAELHTTMAKFFRTYKDQPEVLENTLEQALYQAADQLTNDPTQMITFIDSVHGIIADGLLESELPGLEQAVLGLHNNLEPLWGLSLPFQAIHKLGPLSPDLMTPMVPPR